MEESIIYLPTKSEEKIAINRIEYDTFFLEQKREKLKLLLEKKYRNKIPNQKILHSFEKHSFAVFLGKVEQKSYYLYNAFCFQRNWECCQWAEREMYQTFLQDYVSCFSYNRKVIQYPVTSQTKCRSIFKTRIYFEI